LVNNLNIALKIASQTTLAQKLNTALSLTKEHVN